MSKAKSVVLRLLPYTSADVAQGDWLVGPCGQTRDSDLVEAANFQYLVEQMDELDPNYTDHEVLGWNHWAVGWIEEMTCRPGSACRALQESLGARLEEHPVLCEDTLATLELEQAMHDSAGPREDNEDDSEPDSEMTELNLDTIEDLGGEA